VVPIGGTRETRAWLGRIALSIGFALAAGLAIYLLARAVGSVTLFVRHQDLLRKMATALSGGLDGLAGGDLRGARQLLEQLDARNELISLIVGFLAAALAAVVG
jgi:hypothetical protein